MTWKELVADPNLRDLPYKIETNEWGQIVMTPTRNKHGAYQFKLAAMVDDLMRQVERAGIVVTESAIQTNKGTKVADVAWYSAERWAIVQDEYDASVAPELCLEIISPDNSTGEIEEKRQLYFAAGAQEVWVCSDQGRLTFYAPSGELVSSALLPDFPKTVAVPTASFPKKQKK